MEKEMSIKICEEKKVRTVWDEEKEEWCFSVVDAIEILTGSANPRHYWTVLKGRLITERNESVTSCNRLKMLAAERSELSHELGQLKLQVGYNLYSTWV